MDETKKEPKESIKAIKKNSEDLSGNKITNVFARGNEYVIYEIDDTDINNRLRVIFDGYTDESEKRLQDRFNKVKQNFIIAKGLLYNSSSSGMMKNRIAHALSSALTSDDIDGNKEFESLIINIKNEINNSTKNRIAYLIPIFILFFLFSIIFIIRGNIILPPFLNTVNVNAIATIGFGSTLGGLMSVLYTVKQYNFENYLKRKYYYSIGLERAAISITAGIIIYIATKSRIILPDLFIEDIWVVLFLMIIAGFSESFVPSILNKFSTEK